MSASPQVYVVEVEADVNLCAKRNDHQRSLADIQKVGANFLSINLFVELFYYDN